MSKNLVMHLVKTSGTIAQAVLDFVLPAKCLSCRTVVAKQGNICPECWNSIEFIASHKCHICGLPFQVDLGKNAICSGCELDKPRFNKAVAVCKYEGIGRKLAIGLKFGDQLHLAKPMAQMMVNRGNEVLEKADIITAVPLHYRRKFKRKYNQSSLLAREIARGAAINYDPFLLKRIRNTKQQTKLLKRDRKMNVEEAFAVGQADITGKNILLVDDVMTTGATLSSCAKALKERGAKKVYCLVFARVMPE